MQSTMREIVELIVKYAPSFGWLVQFALIIIIVEQIAKSFRGIFPPELFRRKSRLSALQELLASNVVTNAELRSITEEMLQEEAIRLLFRSGYSLKTVDYLAKLRNKLGPTTSWESLKHFRGFVDPKEGRIRFRVGDWIILWCWVLVSVGSLGTAVIVFVAWLPHLKPESLITLIGLTINSILCLVLFGFSAIRSSIYLRTYKASKLDVR